LIAFAVLRKLFLPSAHISLLSSARRLRASATLRAALFGMLLLSPRQPLWAQTVKPDSDPGISGEGFVDYVGHFGEVFKLRGGWTVDPSMHGEVEVINYYPKYRDDAPPEDMVPFKPKPEDFAPANFSRLSLVQLIIIPRSADAFQSLGALKAAKIKDLEASGVKYHVVDNPYPTPFAGLRWPDGTFEILVGSPYRLSQVYAATTSHLCILTSGIDTPPSTEISSHYGFLRSDLQEWLSNQQNASAEKADTSSAVAAKGISLHPFTVSYIWKRWLWITGLAILLAGVLGRIGRFERLRRISILVLIFSNAGGLIGALCGLCFWPFHWSGHHLPAAAAVACLFTPALGFLVGRLRGIGARRQALIGSSLWAFVAAAFLAYCSLFDWGAPSAGVPAISAIIAFMFYAVGGAVFGALDSSQSSSVDPVYAPGVGIVPHPCR